MRLGHQAAQFGQVAFQQRLGRSHCAQVFADHMAGAHERFGRHLVTPFLEIFECCIAQKGTPGRWLAMTAQAASDRARRVGKRRRQRVLDHGVGNDQRDMAGIGAS